MPDNVHDDGGSATDRSRILEVHQAYLDANSTFDWKALRPIWSDDPTNVFFNMNGHTYVGLEHWTRLWQFYQKNVTSAYWTPFDIGGVVSDDLAVLWCYRHTKSDWVGSEPPPRNRSSRPPWMSCSTCTRNSISRMPPRPSFTLPRPTFSPSCASTRAFISFMSATVL